MGPSLMSFRIRPCDKGLSSVDLAVSWVTQSGYMKPDIPTQSVPQLLLSILGILRRIVCLVKLGPQLGPLFWCHFQDGDPHLGLDVLALQEAVGGEVYLLTAPEAHSFSSLHLILSI